MQRTKANQDFENRKEEKKERYTNLAEKNSKLSDSTFSHARKMASVIPFGQPILVGHHSEKADRNFRKRIDNNFRKSIEQQDKADYYTDKAKNYGSGGIMSDDPEAIVKLKEKILELEKSRNKYKEINKGLNKVIRKYKTIEKTSRFCSKPWKEYDHEAIKKDFDILKIDLKKVLPELEDKTVCNLLTKPEYGNCYGIAGYQITSLTTRIREANKRIEYMKIEEVRHGFNREFSNGVKIKEEDGRINIYFGYKPEKEIRDIIKRSPFSFKYSPSREAWTRKKTETMGNYFFTELEKYLEKL